MSDYAFIAIPAYAVLDRLFGAEKPSFQGKKAVIAGLALGVGYLAGGLFGLALGALWIAYRALPFFGGSGAPQKPEHLLCAALRHAVVVPASALIARQMGGDVPMVAATFGLYAALAFALAAAYGRLTAEHIKDGEPGGAENAFIEALRGLLYGGAIYVLAT